MILLVMQVEQLGLVGLLTTSIMIMAVKMKLWEMTGITMTTMMKKQTSLQPLPPAKISLQI